MARLHEYQGKALLKRHGIAVPEGGVARTPEEAREIAAKLLAPGTAAPGTAAPAPAPGAASGGPARVVLKVQAWVTGRAAQGGVQFAANPAEAGEKARQLLAMRFGNFPVSEVLIEEAIDIRDELFVSLSIDDAARAPVLLIDLRGGSGIEERAATVKRLPIDVRRGTAPGSGPGAIAAILRESAIEPRFHAELARVIEAVFTIARQYEARSVEINPLVTTRDGRIMAADCRMTIDDYAVFRHPELGIDIARELDHPPTELERIAYAVEQADHRGTFYFAQLPGFDHGGIDHGEHGELGESQEKRLGSRSGPGHTPAIPHSVSLRDLRDLRGKPESGTVSGGGAIGGGAAFPPLPRGEGRGEGGGGLIGFHGAGGGGSMMSMDAITNAGFTLANFCDTSGNPSAAKVYKAARIILAQPGLVGYFGSGSGVASQEQFWSAYGLAKAFTELELDIPAVIRLGGNAEDRAVEILTTACRHLRDAGGVVEGYRKDDTPAKCAARFAELVKQTGKRQWKPRPRSMPPFVGRSYSFPLAAGSVWIDHDRCDAATSAFIIEHSSWLLKAAPGSGRPVLAVTEAEVANKDSEMIMLEIECLRAGMRVVFVDLPVPGLDSAAAPDERASTIEPAAQAAKTAGKGAASGAGATSGSR